jgi:hypothetical protein
MTEAMLEQQAGRLSDELEGSFQQAVDLAANAELHGILGRAVEDPRLRTALEEGGPKALSELGVGIPDELDVRFFQRQIVVKPVPDFEQYSIRLLNCRKVWVKREDGKGYEEVQLCLGFEITSHGVTPIG